MEEKSRGNLGLSVKTGGLSLASNDPKSKDSIINEIEIDNNNSVPCNMSQNGKSMILPFDKHKNRENITSPHLTVSCGEPRSEKTTAPCIKAVNLVSDLPAHKDIKPESGENKGFQCFKSDSGENDVPGNRPYSCPQCDYRCTTNGNLKIHLRTHTGEKPFACSDCDYKFSQIGSLKRHAMLHSGKKQYLCMVCDYKCCQSSDLKIHIRSHTGEKPFFCPDCDFRCSNSSNLSKHMKVHTGEKRYSCTICSYKSLTATRMKTHLLTHTGEKPYSCSECNYRTARAESLKTHFKKHERERLFVFSNLDEIDTKIAQERLEAELKPFACDECSFRCTTRSYLKKHVMKKHSDPDICSVILSKTVTEDSSNKGAFSKEEKS